MTFLWKKLNILKLKLCSNIGLLNAFSGTVMEFYLHRIVFLKLFHRSLLASSLDCKIRWWNRSQTAALLWQFQAVLWAGLDRGRRQRCIFVVTASWWGLSLSFHVCSSPKKSETAKWLQSFPLNVTARTLKTNFMLVSLPAQRVTHRGYCLCAVDQLNFISAWLPPPVAEVCEVQSWCVLLVPSYL